MLKRRIIKKILISTGALFALLLIYLIPSNIENNEMDVSKKIDIGVNKASIYLLDNNNMLAKTSVIVNGDNPIDIASELIDVLIIGGKGESTIPSGFRSFIPSDVVINGITLEQGVFKIDFNDTIKDINSDLEMSLVEAITYTLTELPNVDGVIITVSGNNLDRLPNSNEYIPILLTRDFGINKKYDITSINDIKKVTEYYVSKFDDEYYYVPVTKYVNDERDKIKIIIEDLTSSNIYMTNLMSFINSNTKLLKANLEDDIIKLTFNSYILNDFDKKDILEEVINTISLSVKDNYDVNEVIFYVDDDEICKSVLKTLE